MTYTIFLAFDFILRKNTSKNMNFFYSFFYQIILTVVECLHPRFASAFLTSKLKEFNATVKTLLQ